MDITWILLSLLLGCGAASNDGECNTTHVEQCLKHIVNFERQGFLLYGNNEEELDETCDLVSESSECIMGYWHRCHKKTKVCDEECLKMLEHLKHNLSNRGLKIVSEELCNNGTTRDAYLENVSCFERNADSYGLCHNRTKISEDCAGTDVDGELPTETAIECCSVTWYHDCFTNITRSNCNEKAADFVSSLLQTLLSHVSEKVCIETDEDVHGEEITEDAPTEGESVTEHNVTVKESAKSDAVLRLSSLWTVYIAIAHIYISIFLK